MVTNKMRIQEKVRLIINEEFSKAGVSIDWIIKQLSVSIKKVKKKPLRLGLKVRANQLQHMVSAVATYAVLVAAYGLTHTKLLF